MSIFKWQRGRQDTGYDKVLLLTGKWPLGFDCYLIKYPEGSSIPPHKDPVATGRHYRLNIILWKSPEGGEFVCDNPILSLPRIKLFRPDQSEHSVTTVKGGSRYILSIGWIFKKEPQ
jgi:hypothetical protein